MTKRPLSQRARSRSTALRALLFSLACLHAPILKAEVRKTYVESKKLWYNYITHTNQMEPEPAIDAWVAKMVSELREPEFLISISPMQCQNTITDEEEFTVHQGPGTCTKTVLTGNRNMPGVQFSGKPGTHAWTYCPAGAKGILKEFEEGVRDYTLLCYYQEESPPPNACSTPKVGNPIDVFTGAKEESIDVLDSPIDIRLHYHSKRGWTPSFVERLVDRDGGKDWLKGWDCIPGTFEGSDVSECSRIIGLTERLGAAPGTLDITHQQADGSFAEFNVSGKSATIGSNEILEIGTSAESKYTVRSATSVKVFDSAGRITSRSSSSGAGVRYTYLDVSGQKLHAQSPACDVVTTGSGLPTEPSCMTDLQTGRQLNFSYSAEGLTRITAPGNKIVEIAYNGDRVHTRSARRGLNLITSIKFTDGTSQFFDYNEEDKTGGGDFPHYLTSKSDRGGSPLSEFFYEAGGRATVSQKVNGADRFEVQPPCYGCDTFSITGPDGTLRKAASRTFLYNLRPGHVGYVPMVARNEQPAGAGCAAASESLNRDSTGVLQDSIDLNGNKTCFSIDEVTNREKFRIEGVAREDSCAAFTQGNPLPAGARRISSEWHPRWEIATRIASPKLISTFVYNGQPDPFNNNAVANCVAGNGTLPDQSPIAVLCKRVDQATTDINGYSAFDAPPQAGVSSRTSSWTYDSKGRVLTAKDARSVVTSTNEYYPSDGADWKAGDLKSTKNALNQSTEYLRYNTSGKVLESRDPNGISTVFGYDDALRPVSTSIAGAVSMFEYFTNGLLKKTTTADGKVVNYEYDAARRLTAVADSYGNRIEYTLDASGKRIKEEAKDPSGTLKRTMSRVYDALGRAQQTTGRE